MTVSRKLPICTLLAVALSACSEGATPPAAAPVEAVAAPNAGDAAVLAFRPLARGLPSDAPEVACALDTINEIPAAAEVANLETGGEARFIGWIADAQLQVPTSFRIVLEGETVHGVDAIPGTSRPDVAEALKSPALASSGFNVVAVLSDVPPGNYTVRLMLGDDVQAWRCNSTARVTVVGAPR